MTDNLSSLLAYFLKNPLTQDGLGFEDFSHSFNLGLEMPACRRWIAFE
ncbi:MAG: hypothetical protein FWG75_10685 [Cystobacterineae bacterium]|nr:hypothetical protein [Cystobacterineae bacterium]